MIKETVSYTDFNGKVKKEDLYFNLSKLECLDISAKLEKALGNGGIVKFLEKCEKEQDYASAYELFKFFVDSSYGHKSADGSRFIKPSKEELEDFKKTELYSEFIYGIISDVEKGLAFIRGIFPKGFTDGGAAKQISKKG